MAVIQRYQGITAKSVVQVCQIIPSFAKGIEKSYQAIIIAVSILPYCGSVMNSTLALSGAIVDDDADVGEALQLFKRRHDDIVIGAGNAVEDKFVFYTSVKSKTLAFTWR